MHPGGGVEIEPDRPGLPDDVGGLGLLRAVRGRGADPGGAVEVELDAVGDLVDVVVSDLAAQSGAAALAAAFRAAHAAAREATARLLEDHAEEIVARSRTEQSANLERLEAIAARANAQFDEMAAKLAAIAGREQAGG